MIITTEAFIINTNLFDYVKKIVSVQKYDHEKSI